MAVIYFLVIPQHFKCFATRIVKYIADACRGILSDSGWMIAVFCSSKFLLNGQFQGGLRVLESAHYCHVRYSW